MTRINTNVQSLIAQRSLRINNQTLDRSLERLSTGLRINRGKDDPAGLIASQNLRAELAGLNKAVGNNERANVLTNVAEGGLVEVSSLLTELQGLLTTSANTAGLSDDERAANQLEVDSILQTIDRIADSTSFQGVKLLNGSFDFTASNIDVGVTDYEIRAARLGFEQTVEVNMTVTTSAQQGGLYLSTNGAIDLNGGVNSTFQIEIRGTRGSRELSFSSGVSLANVASIVNSFTDVTGVTATASGTGIRLESEDYGEDAFVNVVVIDDADIQGTAVGVYNLEDADFNTAQSSGTAFSATAAGDGIRDLGQDIEGTINGQLVLGKGLQARVNDDFLDVQLTMTASAAQTVGTVSALRITGGGAKFQLSGKVQDSGVATLGIQNVNSRKLGNATVGLLGDLASGRSYNIQDGNLNQAQDIVSEAISQVSLLRGSIGAFQKNVLGATERNLGVAIENTSAAESVIRDSDFAVETAGLTRSQILSQASTNVLSLANSQPQAVLGLLG